LTDTDKNFYTVQILSLLFILRRCYKMKAL